MKRLTLIRHAKSDWEYPELDDHDRPLNKRGLETAPKVGNYLMENDVNPDIMLSSTANRAITTAKLIAKKLQFRQQKIQAVTQLNSKREIFIQLIRKSFSLKLEIVLGGIPNLIKKKDLNLNTKTIKK